PNLRTAVTALELPHASCHPAANTSKLSGVADHRWNYGVFPQGTATREPNDSGTIVSSGNFSSIRGVGHGRVGVHVHGGDAGVQLFLSTTSGHITITDPQNWVALFAFLVTSITGSRLSSRIRREADVANRRRREIE